MKIVCLLSGGIDSVTLLFRLRKNENDLIPLFINYGQKASRKEYESAITACKKLGLELHTIDISGLSTISSGLTDKKYSHIEKPLFPARNLILLSIATAFADSKSAQIVAIGIVGDANFPDQTNEFIENSESALSSATGKMIKILAPLIKLNKLEVVRLAKENNIPLDFTYSCYLGSEKPCNECLSCKERQVVFKLEGLSDNP